MRDINLKATEYFEAVARLGTVTKAAEELGVSPSAVSQQIRLLEAQFGVKLFRREKRRLRLTLDGDRLFQTTTQAFGALRNARNAIARQRDTRSLTIRVSPSFGVRWLGPRIAGFAAVAEKLHDHACTAQADHKAEQNTAANRPILPDTNGHGHGHAGGDLQHGAEYGNSPSSDEDGDRHFHPSKK